MPLLTVTSYQEIRPATRIQPIGRIALEGTDLRPFTVASPWKP